MTTDDELIDELRRALTPLRPRADLAATVLAAAASPSAAPRRLRAWRRPRHLSGAVGFAASAAIVIAVVIVVIAGHRSTVTVGTAITPNSSRELAALSQSFAVLRRWHTTISPSGLVAPSQPTTTFLARKLNDGARVWLTAATTSSRTLGLPIGSAAIYATFSPFGSSPGTQPQSPLMSELAAGDRVRVQPVSEGGPDGELDVELVPDGVTHVRWVAVCTGGVPCASQHHARPARTVLTVPVINNIAAGRIGTTPAGRGPVIAVTWLGADNQVLVRFRHVGAHTTAAATAVTTHPQPPATNSRFMLGTRALGPLRFGATIDQARSVLDPRLGAPQTIHPHSPVGASSLCGVTAQLTWPLSATAAETDPRAQTLELFFFHNKLEGYQDGSESSAALTDHPNLTLRTARGLTVGDSLAGGRTLYGHAFHVSEEQDGTWSIGRTRHHLDGFSTQRPAGTLQGRILSIDAGGTGCPALSP